MRQAIIHEDLTVTYELDAHTPTPAPNEVIIRAVTAGLNPIDWKGAKQADADALHGELESALHRASGKDFAGYVHSVGSQVVGYRVGDRVTALNHSSGFAEYSVGPEHTIAIVPSNVSFEEAATFPLIYITAALSLFRNTNAPTPWNPAKTGSHNPLLIYGASSALGTTIAKLASLANIHPIIAVGGRTASRTVQPTLDASKGDTLVDYNGKSESELIAAVRTAVGGDGQVKYGVDVIAEESTANLVAEVLNPTESYLALCLPVNFTPKVSSGTKWKVTFAPGLFESTDEEGPYGKGSDAASLQAFSTLCFRYLTFAMQRGLIKAHPHVVPEGGLARLEDGLKDYKSGRNGSLKYVYRIRDTEWGEEEDNGKGEKGHGSAWG